MGSDWMVSLTQARHLMDHQARLEARRKGVIVPDKTVLDELKEDQALLSGQTAGVPENAAARPASANTDISLADISGRFKSIQQGTIPAQKTADGTAARMTTFTFQKETTETGLDVHYRALPPVEGLVRVSAHLAETDRYAFEFQDGTTFKISDKWSNKSTTIWGDPHIDTSDQEGANNGDFQDLRASDRYTTFQLEDGTRVTFTAQDAGVIEAVDITKGSQQLHGLGAASSQWSEETGLFSEEVKRAGSSAEQVPLGDVVYAGGDGADWFNSSGQLVWGKTTGPHITQRPTQVMDIQVRQTYSTEQLTVQMMLKA